MRAWRQLLLQTGVQTAGSDTGAECADDGLLTIQLAKLQEVRPLLAHCTALLSAVLTRLCTHTGRALASSARRA